MGFHIDFIALTIQLGHFQLYPNSAGAFWSICVLGQVWISSELQGLNMFDDDYQDTREWLVL
jgi:hypothetical protein